MTNEETLEALAEEYAEKESQSLDWQRGFIRGHASRDSEVQGWKESRDLNAKMLEVVANQLLDAQAEIAELKKQVAEKMPVHFEKAERAAAYAELFFKYNEEQEKVSLQVEYIKRLEKQLASQKQAAQGLVEALEQISGEHKTNECIDYTDCMVTAEETLAQYRKTLEGV
jgi:recombinational DNA repair ATPase RecF